MKNDGQDLVRSILPAHLQEDGHEAMRLIPGETFARVNALFCRHPIHGKPHWAKRKVIGPYPSGSHFNLLGAWAISYMLEGEAILRREGKEDRLITPGTLFHILGDPHNNRAWELRPVTEFFDCSMFFDLARARQLLSMGIFERDFDPVDVGLQAALIQGYLDLYRVIEDVTVSPAAVFRQAIGLLHLFAQEIESSSGDDAFVVRAKRLLRENLQPGYTMREAAGALNMPYSSFRGAFTRAVGISPGEFQIRERMDRARDLLRQHTVRQTAALLGYTDEYYFSNQFKQIMGASPGSFRKR